MNDVILNKKKINMFIGEQTLKAVDRPYTYDEIRKILDVSDIRKRVIIGLMYAAGLRIGAISELRLRHIEKIESCYKVVVYEGSKEQYYTFVTPEVSSFIDSYLQYRSTNGEQLGPDSYLIRDQFDITDQDQIRNKSRGIATCTLEAMLSTLLIKAGVRTIDHVNPYKRKEVARAHGFRKFYTNQLIKSKILTEYRWQLEGHKLKGNDSHYIRTTIDTLYKAYESAIDNLTINEENRLKKKVKILQIEVSRLDKLESSLKKLEQKYNKG